MEVSGSSSNRVLNWSPGRVDENDNEVVVST